MSLDDILTKARKEHASDIHFTVDESVWFRIGKTLIYKDTLSVNKLDFLIICERSELSFTLDENKEKIYLGFLKQENDITGSRDGAFSFLDVRIRVHLFLSQRKICGVLRFLYGENLSLLQDIDHEILTKLCCLNEGLILVVGATGSGKTYTLGCCLEYINSHAAKHIITLEDPIEHIFSPKRSCVQQRQLGQDVDSMASGLRDALREDPDVIMIGELRDRETLEAALEAAETGHLVFATLHTQRALLAVSRMISMFSSERQEEVRHQLSFVLKGIICQRLAFLENDVIPIREILLNTPAVANLLRQKKEAQILSIQETSPGMQTFNKAITTLSKKYGHSEIFEEAVRDMDALF